MSGIVSPRADDRVSDVTRPAHTCSESLITSSSDSSVYFSHEHRGFMARCKR